MKIDLKESLNELDMLSDNKYDLYNTYLAENLDIEKKKRLVEAIYKNKSPKDISLILKEDWDDAAWHDTADQEQVDQPDYFPDGEEESEWTEMDSKSVRDSDGFLTDYTWYWRNNNGEDQHVFVFGDSDLYGPEDGYFDWECDSLEEAQEWFDSYVGPGDDEDDLMNESLDESKKYKDLYFGEINFKLKNESDKQKAEQIMSSVFGDDELEGGKFSFRKTKSGYMLKYYGNIGSIYYEKYFKEFIKKMKNLGVQIQYKPESPSKYSKSTYIMSLDDEEKVKDFLNESLDESATYNYDKYYLRKRSFIRQYSLDDILSFLHSKGYDINDEETKEYAKGVQDYMNWVDKSYDEPPKSLEDWYEETMFNYSDDLDELPKINESLNEDSSDTYKYTGSVTFDNLKDPHHDSVDKNDLYSNLFDFDIKKDTSLDSKIRKAIEKVDYDIYIDNENDHKYDDEDDDSYDDYDDDDGSSGSISITIITNRILSKKEIDKLENFYVEAGNESYFTGILDDLVFTKYSNKDTIKQLEHDCYMIVFDGVKKFEETFIKPLNLYGYSNASIYGGGVEKGEITGQYSFSYRYKNYNIYSGDYLIKIPVDEIYSNPEKYINQIFNDLKDAWLREVKDVDSKSVDESLNEKMVRVEPTEKELNQVINVLTKYGFKVDDNYKPGRGLFGSYHIQVINPDLDYIDFDQLVKDVEPVGDALDNLSFDINMPITYNFGANDNNVITGGIDIHVGYKEDDMD